MARQIIVNSENKSIDVTVEARNNIELTISRTASYTGVQNIIAGNNISVANANGNVTITTSNNISIPGNLVANGNITGNSNLIITENANIGGNLNVDGNISSNNNLTLNGNITANGDVTANAIYGNVYGNVVGNIVVPGTQGDILYNDNGNAGASTNLSYSTSNNTLSLNGNITTNNLLVNNYVESHLIPSSNVSYDLGGPSNYWRDLYLSGTTIFIGPQQITADGSGISFTGTVSVSNISGDGTQLSSINGANVSGNVPYASYAYSVDAANVNGDVAGANHANIADIANVSYSVDGANVNGDVAGANRANVADVANSVSGSNVSGQVANALEAGSVYTASQPNITSVGTLVNLTVSGNANVQTDLNVTGNALVTGNLTVQGNTNFINVDTLIVQDPIIQLGGGPNGAPLTTNDGKDRGTLLHYYTTAPVDAFMGWDNSNAEFSFGSNVSISNDVITFNALGNIRANELFANISGTNVIGDVAGANHANIADAANSVAGANVVGDVSGANHANVADVANSVSGSNVVGDVSGANHANIADVANSVAGANVSGQVANALVAGTVYTNAQPNITSVGTLSNLNVTGNTTASYFIGNGSALSDITGANVTGQVANALVAGTVYTNAQPNITSVGNLSSLAITGNLTTVDAITYDTTANIAIATVGTTAWDDGEGTLAIGLKGGNVTLSVGTEQLARVYNAEANTLVDGEVVYVYGAQGNRISVKRAQANSEVTSKGTLGFVTENIASGAEGFVTTSGTVNKLNTFGLTAGDSVYLSATTPGAWTTTAPASPNHLVVLGWIERVSSTVGSIYTKVDNGYELDELHDVTIANAQSGQALVYDSANLIWTNGNPNVANTALSVNVANVVGIGNIATINLNGNSSQILAGDGNWIATPSTANANYANFAGNVVNAVQSNITSVGTLSSLNVTGNVTATNFVGNIPVANVVGLGNIATINLTGNSGQVLLGNGGWGTATSANANYANFAGDVVNAVQSNITSVGTLSSLNVTGNVTASHFVGNGAALTSISGANISGNVPSANVAYFANVTFVSNTTLSGRLLFVDAGASNGNYQFLTNNQVSFNSATSTLTAPQGRFIGTNGIATTKITSSSGSECIQIRYNSIDGAVGINTNLTVGANGTGNLTVTGTSNLNAVGNVIITGGSNGQVLTTNGSGGLSWTTVTGGNAVPGGSNTQVQFNDAGSFAGSANLTFDKTTNTLSATNITGTLTTNAQPNITSVGNLSVLNVDGIAQFSNLTQFSNLVTVAGYDLQITSPGIFKGDGSGISNLPAGNISGQVGNALIAGTVYTNAQPNITSVGTLVSLTVSGNANITNTNLVKFGETVVNGGNTGAATLTPDAAAGTIYKYNLTGNITLNTLSNAVAGTSMTIILTQDANGSRLLTSTMKFAGGSKTLSTTANTTDIVSVFYDGTTYFASLVKGFV